MSIYVPADLKASMDQLRRVNWSGVAQAAFEIEIRRKPTFSEDKMTEVIERLRASKQKMVNEDLQGGFDAGRKWAEENAEFSELRRVAKLGDPDDEDDFGIDYLPRLLDPEQYSTPHEFWEAIMDAGVVNWSSAFTVGFIRGAKAVWKEVEQQL